MTKLAEKLDLLLDDFVCLVNTELNEGVTPETVLTAVARFTTFSVKVVDDIILERGKPGREAFIESQLNAISEAKFYNWRRRRGVGTKVA